jgi:hypothetical protein
MQQLEIEHKKSNNSKQVVSEKSEELDQRERKGSHLALSRNVYRIQNTDTFYVESETSKDLYYFVRYNPSVFEWCSCPDNSYRKNTCKHIFCIIASIKKGRIIDVDKLPQEAKRDSVVPESYRDDDYEF